MYRAGGKLDPTLEWLSLLGPMLPALPGLPPPAELRELAYFNTTCWLVCLINPTLFAMWKVCYQGDALRSWSILLGHQSALAKSGQYVVRTMRRNTAAPGTPCSDATSVPGETDGSNGETDGSNVVRLQRRRNLPRGPSGLLLARLLAPSNKQAAEDQQSAKQLGRGLPWLPAFDRRDSLTVRLVLDHMTHHKARQQDIWALAF